MGERGGAPSCLEEGSECERGAGRASACGRGARGAGSALGARAGERGSQRQAERGGRGASIQRARVSERGARAPPPHPCPGPRPRAPWQPGAARLGEEGGGRLGGSSQSSLGKGRACGPRSAPGCWTPGFGAEQCPWALCTATPVPTHLGAGGGACGGSHRWAGAPADAGPRRGVAGRQPLGTCSPPACPPGSTQGESSVTCACRHAPRPLYPSRLPGSVLSASSFPSCPISALSVAGGFPAPTSVRISECPPPVSGPAALGSSRGFGSRGSLGGTDLGAAGAGRGSFHLLRDGVEASMGMTWPPTAQDTQHVAPAPPLALREPS